MEENSVRWTLQAVRAEIGAFTLPTWEEMPALPLYMDQVILLLNRYLRMAQDAAEERGVTPAMINNYVKQRLVPPPEKKRYGRRHLAYLTMVCLLKQSISTGEISKLLPVEPDEERTRALILETQSCNAAAIAFYQQCGLSIMGFNACEYSNEDIAKHEVRLEMGCLL